MQPQLVKTADGRTLAVQTFGNPAGRPVFLLHGMPGSRLGPTPRSTVLYNLGVRLIAFDRPGYGSSDRLRGRQVAAAAIDVQTIADELGLGRFAVVARSGGGPHALACGALLPERVHRVAALVSLAPWDAEDLDWYAGMTPSNIRDYRAAERDHQRIAATIQLRARRIMDDPAALLAGLRSELSSTDRLVVSDAGIRRMLQSNYREAFRQNADGWIDDILAFTTDWGFKVQDVAAPTWLWHGADDMWSPVGHSRWLAAHIPDATLFLEPGAAHFGSLRVLTAALKWAAG
ncbi:pimeloyl-ACP methyl ester carboxylesterase [Kitasatospora sp. MAA4]|uniref:alpha/beta fold hydrolase n=1 Tax=Kitasatospora sp. MAA4 TaxID=3035093 RepID=UPI002474C6C2|nr:alpha/beta fold hydrolase [Kitasatospora sp. MAA4]MDH6133968.1 pimeloyl-ACP methyl ester carboxylesterase [Kitasatospora sp. MAA4]